VNLLQAFTGLMSETGIRRTSLPMVRAKLLRYLLARCLGPHAADVLSQQALRCLSVLADSEPIMAQDLCKSKEVAKP
jgi:hypothetical protein